MQNFQKVEIQRHWHKGSKIYTQKKCKKVREHSKRWCGFERRDGDTSHIFGLKRVKFYFPGVCICKPPYYYHE